MGKHNKRAIAVFTLAVAVVIAWLTTATLYRWANYSLPIVALVAMYGILAWQLRWWRELKYRIPVAMLGGATLLSMLRPATVAVRNPSRSLFSMHQGFYAVNWALIGATLFALVILLIAPMNLRDRNSPTTLDEFGG